jgi:hypothetical protein
MRVLAVMLALFALLLLREGLRQLVVMPTDFDHDA